MTTAQRNERNLGITQNCNEILRRCTGRYVAFYAGDDLFLQGKISRQVAAMESAQAVLSYHDIEVFADDTGHTIRYWNTGPRSARPVTGASRKVAMRLIEDGTTFMGTMDVSQEKAAKELGLPVRPARTI